MHPSLLKKQRSTQPVSEGHVHIDRLHISGPLEHPPTGDVIYKAVRDSSEVVPVGVRSIKPKRGSRKANDEVYHHSHDLHSEDLACAIEFDCCPPKALQNHNVFGHANVAAYAYDIFCQQTDKLGIAVRPEDREDWKSGLIRVTEIHLTANFKCPPNQRELIHAIDQNNVIHKTKDFLTSITLGSSPKGRSAYYTVTVYSKYDELSSQWKNPGQYQRRLMDLAKESIRVEVKLFSQALRTRDLQFVSRWENVDVDALFFEILEKYDVIASIQPLLTDDEKGMLPARLRKTYTLWLGGTDFKDLGGRTTVWKHRKEILALTGIDIRGARRPDALPQICTADIFKRENILAVPDWMQGTELFWPAN